MKAFEPGKTYTARSPGDYDRIVSITVSARTAKTITTSAGKRLGVKVWDDREHVSLGRYSMAPVISA